MKYEILVPTEANTEFFNGPVIFREDGKAIAFCNVHGNGQACVDEVLNCLAWQEGMWEGGEFVEEVRKQTSVEGMFETFYHEVAE